LVALFYFIHNASIVDSLLQPPRSQAPGRRYDVGHRKRAGPKTLRSPSPLRTVGGSFPSYGSSIREGPPAGRPGDCTSCANTTGDFRLCFALVLPSRHRVSASINVLAELAAEIAHEPCAARGAPGSDATAPGGWRAGARAGRHPRRRGSVGGRPARAQEREWRLASQGARSARLTYGEHPHGIGRETHPVAVLRRVTLPLIRPVLLVTVLFSAICFCRTCGLIERTYGPDRDAVPLSSLGKTYDCLSRRISRPGISGNRRLLGYIGYRSIER
jgi:hypothetical protein